MRGSDLPPDLRRQLLNTIRDQVGGSNYRAMVDAMGEDRLLDVAVDAATRQGAGSSSSDSSLGESLGEAIGGLIGLALVCGACWLIWVVVSWIVGGVGQWWAWLGGHF